jgi:hypothetical protein
VGWQLRARFHQNISFSPAIQKLPPDKLADAVRQSIDFIVS